MYTRVTNIQSSRVTTLDGGVWGRVYLMGGGWFWNSLRNRVVPRCYV